MLPSTSSEAPKTPLKRLNFSVEQFEHAAVGLVALVEEVDDDDVVLLPVAVAAADALLDPLRVPGQVVVHDQRAELEVDALGCGLGGEQDRGLVAEVLDERRAHVHRARAGGAAGVAVLLDPALVDRGRLRAAVGAVEEHDLAPGSRGIPGRLFRYSCVRRDSVKMSALRAAPVVAICSKPISRALSSVCGLGVDTDAARPGAPGAARASISSRSFCRSMATGGVSDSVGCRRHPRGSRRAGRLRSPLPRSAARQIPDRSCALLVAERLQAHAQGVERAGDGLRRRGQQLAQDQRRQVPLALGKRVAVLALQEGRDRLVQRVLVVASA